MVMAAAGFPDCSGLLGRTTLRHGMQSWRGGDGFGDELFWSSRLDYIETF